MILLLAVFLTAFYAERSEASGQLLVTVYTDKDAYGPGEIVSISGQVLDGNMQGVLLARISIQVNDPTGNPIHVALVVSAADGTYADQFTTPSGPVNGAYSVYVTASKPGYETASSQIACTITPEFPIAHMPWLMLLLALLLALTVRRRRPD